MILVTGTTSNVGRHVVSRLNLEQQTDPITARSTAKLAA